jgi:mRNA-degrading endonuclease toxin of MazEF toxin-antitoxin module
LPESRLRRGAVYLLRGYTFPHERGSGDMTKARPVLILQDDVENRNPRYPFVIVAPLTSRKVDAIYPEDVLLPKGTANLPVTSKVLLGLIFAVTKEALARRIGQVDEDHMAHVNTVLQRLLGLSGQGEGEGGQGAEVKR